MTNYNAAEAYLLNIEYVFAFSHVQIDKTLSNQWAALADQWKLPHDIFGIELICYNLENVAILALRELQTIRPDVTASTFKALFEAKSAGYAGTGNDPWKNFRNCTMFGIPVTVGLITRLSDKITRATNLLMSIGEDRVGESVADTLFDTVAYSCILLTIIDNEGMV